MPNLPSAKKSIRKDRKRRLHNLAIESDLKTLIKKLNSLISSSKKDEAAKLLSIVMSKLDKAAKKNIIKRRNADRKKSRLSAKIAALLKKA
jgi:small subunit ribosomal protein S20